MNGAIYEDVNQRAKVGAICTSLQTVNKGIAGPLSDATGGGSQGEFVGPRSLKVVGQSQPLPKR